LLQKYAYKLTDATHLSDLIPLINNNEKDLLKAEIKNKPISVIFDGASTVGELFAVIFRFLDGWKVKQRLVRVSVLQTTMNNENIAYELVDTISRMYGVANTFLRGWSYDRASPNKAAATTLKALFPKSMFFPCGAHTLDHVGDHFRCENLDNFFSALTNLFSKSYKAKQVWKSIAGSSFPTHSDTRWWSWYEIMVYSTFWKMQRNVISLSHKLASMSSATVHLQTNCMI
jgi:hypothetical protein